MLQDSEKIMFPFCWFFRSNVDRDLLMGNLPSERACRGGSSRFALSVSAARGSGLRPSGHGFCDLVFQVRVRDRTPFSREHKQQRTTQKDMETMPTNSQTEGGEGGKPKQERSFQRSLPKLQGASYRGGRGKSKRQANNGTRRGSRKVFRAKTTPPGAPST